ncbi:hypothetical protein PV328_000971 [Microctonus aethiopoides]|uniref:Peptidase M13 C-terminal domain-containing protein n=1 Tax=Microctonus aethiopoides TaxID=144406 RepID=A0AA39KWT7_9HYME|nr:hypothetical protein PV328_000971 [Microctonus aethiopoides]
MIDWMDEETRKNASEKQAAMSFLIGYPDELLNDEKLENNWVHQGLVAIVDAFYYPQGNSIIIPAGILHGSFFSHNRPKYMNYGAIGLTISNELTHGFDGTGRQMDKHGNNLKNWWTSTTNKRFIRESQCIRDQYGNYTVEEIGKKLNSKHTIGENIADIGGINIAYLAYKNWSKKHEKEQSLAGLLYSPQQMFWISTATIMCSKMQPEYLADMIIEDVRSPNEFRIIGPFSNSPEFAKDFNCPLGSRMNPENKCRFW